MSKEIRPLTLKATKKKKTKKNRRLAQFELDPFQQLEHPNHEREKKAQVDL